MRQRLAPYRTECTEAMFKKPGIFLKLDYCFLKLQEGKFAHAIVQITFLSQVFNPYNFHFCIYSSDKKPRSLKKHVFIQNCATISK